MADSGAPDFEVELAHRGRWAFDVDFRQEGVAHGVMDEPAPLGDQTGPDAARTLAAAVGDCLSASLLFCLRKFEREPEGLETTVRGFMTRNERGHLRVGSLEVTLRVRGLEVDTKVRRCTELFEDHCPVTSSVRQGIPVRVTVTDETGSPLA